MSHRVGVDIGGTFTDLVLAGPKNGQVVVKKVPSTPPDFARGVLDGLEKLGVPVEELSLISHGTTVATNAVLEKKGARTGLITTKGFRDVLEIRRADRGALYDYWWRPPDPLVPRRNRLEVRERIRFDGSILEPLLETDVRECAATLRARGVESVAICFLNSFVNPLHELRAQEIVRAELPDVYVCTSSGILPEILEFERTSTAVANAYVGPVMNAYLADLEKRLHEAGYRHEIFIMGSSGGMMSTEQAREIPVTTALSGLAAGVMAGAAIAEQSGLSNLITMDIGGTSSDIALINDFIPRMTTEWFIEFGVPIRLPAVDIQTLGSGGGSIAWIDPGHALHVGPQSAGALPGPVCYDQGGTEPTTTDAQLVLGRLRSDVWEEQYGWRLNETAARRAMADRVGVPLGLGAIDAAEAIIQVTVNNLVEAIRLISVERGYDPRQFVLCAYGGAGPMYAADIARSLGIPEVVIPIHPGVTSALGLLQVDFKQNLMRSVLMPEDSIDVDAIDGHFADLEARARERLLETGVSADQVRLRRLADVRYFGQSKSMTVGVASEKFGKVELEQLIATFNREHQREYGYTMPEHIARIEIANLRIEATGDVVKLFPRPGANELNEDAVRERSVHFPGVGFVPTKIRQRAGLRTGQTLRGPAIVEQSDTTTVIPPDCEARVDDFGHLVLKIGC